MSAPATSTYVGLLFAAIRIGLGALLVYAGVEKLGAFAWWVAQLDAMKVLPSSWSSVAAAAVAGGEISAGIALAAGVFTRSALLAATALFSAFAASMAFVLATGTAERCACFGPNSSFPISTSHVLLNLLPVAALLFVYCAGPDRFTLERALERLAKPSAA
jgi:uncharacterized membrane protein YphA (DoxX/SURF4 family)